MQQSPYPAIQSFLDYLKFEKRYSPNTLGSYQTDLEQFFHYTEDIFGTTGPGEFTAVIIRSWLASLKNNKISAKSINRKISSLKSFFKYLLKQGVIQQTPAATVISPRNSKRLPVYVEEKDTETLFKDVPFQDDWKGKTDRLVLLMFYHTGMRLSGLLGLKESQLDDSYGQIKVLGKGNRERIIPVSGDLLKEVKEYIMEKPVRLENVSQIFVNEKGKPLYPKYVYNLVHRNLAKVSTIRKKSPHVLRHTFATHLMNQGAELNAVKELLGHSSLAATQIYTHNTIEKLREVFQKAHPKA